MLNANNSSAWRSHIRSITSFLKICRSALLVSMNTKVIGYHGLCFCLRSRWENTSDISHCLPQCQPNVCCTITAGSAFACKLLNKNRFHNIKHCYTQVYWFFPTRPCLLLTSIFGAHLSPGHKGQTAKTWSPRHNKLHAQRRCNACFVKQILSTFHTTNGSV